MAKENGGEMKMGEEKMLGQEAQKGSAKAGDPETLPAAETGTAETSFGETAAGDTRAAKPEESEAVMDDGAGQSVKRDKNKKPEDGSSFGGGSSPAAAPKKKKKIVGKIIMTAVTLLAAGLAVYWALQWQKKKKEASSSANTANTGTVTVQSEMQSTVSSSGTIAAKNTYSITALVSGTIIKADFAEGDQVTKGQILYQIDASSMDSKLTSAQNTLTRAQKAYNQAVTDNDKAKAKYSGGVYTATQTGYITKVDVTDGAAVANNTALLELTDETTMKVRIPFLSAEAAMIAVGSPATLTLSDTMEQVQGTVTGIAAQEEALDGTRLIKYVTVEAANPGGLTTTTTASAVIGEFNSVEEGTFEARQTLSMAADLDANMKIQTVLVHVGDYVTPGTPVFTYLADSVTDVLKTFSDAVDSKKAAVESAQQSLDSTKDTIDNYTITAPIDGQVIKKSYKVGDKIGTGSSSSTSATTLATIYDLSQYTFSMSIDETDISSIAVGQTVAVTADAFSGQTFNGTVTNISLESTVSNGVSTYPVTVTLENTDKLLPGMNVDGKIITASASNAVCVPADALQRGNKVYVKDDTVKTAQGAVPAGFKSVDVTTGMINDDYVQITSGNLTEGETVYLADTSTESSSSMSSMMGPGGEGGGPGGSGGQGGPPQ